MTKSNTSRCFGNQRSKFTFETIHWCTLNHTPCCFWILGSREPIFTGKCGLHVTVQKAIAFCFINFYFTQRQIRLRIGCFNQLNENVPPIEWFWTFKFSEFTITHTTWEIFGTIHWFASIYTFGVTAGYVSATVNPTRKVVVTNLNFKILQSITSHSSVSYHDCRYRSSWSKINTPPCIFLCLSVGTSVCAKIGIGIAVNSSSTIFRWSKTKAWNLCWFASGQVFKGGCLWLNNFNTVYFHMSTRRCNTNGSRCQTFVVCCSFKRTVVVIRKSTVLEHFKSIRMPVFGRWCFDFVCTASILWPPKWLIVVCIPRRQTVVCTTLCHTKIVARVGYLFVSSECLKDHAVIGSAIVGSMARTNFNANGPLERLFGS